MNYYPAPIIAQLQTRVTLSNYTPVEEGMPLSELQVYTAWTDGEKWRLQLLGKLYPNESETFIANDHPAIQSIGDMLLYFLFTEELPDVLDTLPVCPDVLKTQPEWRANIQLRSHSTAVSFQGEYPDVMAGMPKGSCVSINPLAQAGENVATKLMLTNVRINPEIYSRTAVLRGLQSGRIVSEFNIKTNHCNVVDITSQLRCAEEPTVLVSPDMAAGPLYLSHDRQFRYLSLEHTHPPIVSTMFGNTEQRWEMVRNMKRYWIENFGR